MPRQVPIPGLAKRSVDDPWPEFDAEVAVRELEAAGWRKYGGSLLTWESPTGKVFRGPALAWKIYRKHGDLC